jgi:hypothetical protein
MSQELDPRDGQAEHMWEKLARGSTENLFEISSFRRDFEAFRREIMTME